MSGSHEHGAADPYRAFLEAKASLASNLGVDVALDEIHPALKPHQRVAVQWAVRGGRRALFEAFGLGKTLQQLEIVRLTLAKTGGGRGLIVCPLGVRQEFTRDAAMIGLSTTFVRSHDDVERAERQLRLDNVQSSGIYLTNYESVREGKLDPRGFQVVSLDEAAILRGFGGTKTFREFMRMYEGSAAYRFVATATPDPNEYIELLAYAAFLDIGDVGQMKTRFFRRDSTKADHLTIHPHKEREFWLWVASWALFLQRPSDLGPEYADEGYALPPMDVRWHEIPSDHQRASAERDGQARMFVETTFGVSEAAREKRASLDARVQALLEIIKDGDDNDDAAPRVLRGEPGAREGSCPGLPPRESGRTSRVHEGVPEDVPSPGGLQAEARRDEPAEAGAVCVGSRLSGEGEGASQDLDSTEPREEARRPVEGGVQPDAQGVLRDAGQPGRRLRDLRGGDLEGQGEEQGSAQLRRRSRPRDGLGARPSLPELQHGHWPFQGPPGSPAEGQRVSNQVVIWCDLNAEQRAIERALDARAVSYSSIDGATDLEERERLLQDWRDARTTAFVSKPSLYGSGVNLQQCHRAIFLGVSFKFSELVQAVHRIHRFLQPRPVRIDLIYTEAEREVRRALEAKWRRHDEQTARMSEIIREYGLATAAMANALRRTIGVERQEVTGDGYRLVNADAVEETRTMASESVHLIVTSIPFATQYEYTPSYNDFGHTESNEHFWRQMDFLTPELFRVLQPGRVMVIHVKDRIVPSGMTGLGFQTVSPLHCEAVAHYRGHGFGYLGMITVVTDVVRENNQTYRLGWTEQCKDGTKQGRGMPEYLLLFRRPPTDRSNGYADVPVVKGKAAYTLARWQVNAAGFARSSGDRLLTADDLATLPHERIYKLWRRENGSRVYDYERHIALVQAMQDAGRLPVTFALMPAHSWHQDVWTDVARMRTLNMDQQRHAREMHLCPLQFDIVDRLLVELSMPGEIVFDPFCGLGTVAYCAVKLGRRGLGVELSATYHADAVRYCEAAAREVTVPTLFDLLDEERELDTT